MPRLDPRRLVPLVLLASVVLALPGVSGAGPASETLRRFFDEASRIVTAPDPDRGLESRRAEVRALADRLFDFRAAAAVALGPAWATRTAAEREEFTRLFADLAERGYLTLVGSKARVAGGVRVRFLGEAADPGGATVRTSLLTRGGNELPVEYRMRASGGRWTVQDVLVEGVSLVENYRAQFRRALQGASYPEVVALLRARTPEPSSAVVVAIPPATTPPVPIAVPRVLLAAAVAPDDTVIPVVDVPPARSVPMRSSALPPALPQPAAEPPAARTGRREPAPAAATPIWWVQVGAFRSAEATSRLLRHLEQERAIAVFEGAETEPIARVLVGPFSQRTLAVAKRSELQAGGYPAFVTSLR